MLLNAVVDDQSFPVEVPDEMLEQAGEFFEQMDRDMDRGCQIGRDWVESPDRNQRCQVVADRLLTALENRNPSMMIMMAGYILSRLPEVTAVTIDSSGDPSATWFHTG
ncbi:MAG: hypothetical protein PVG82_04980 [Chromatiales bacterium]|jgi:hypothetical protein